MNETGQAQLNLLDLEMLFYSPGSDARAGFEVLSRSTLVYQDFRWYDLMDFDDSRASKLEQCIDGFLAYCAILELACLSRYVVDQDVRALYHNLPTETHTFVDVLRLSPVDEYYEHTFPLPLVRDFVNRMIFRSEDTGHSHERATRFFQRFVAIELDRRDNAAAKAFFRILSVYGPYEFERVMRARLETPQSLVDLLLRPVETLDEIESAIVGLHDLLEFCITYDAFLETCKSDIVLQRAFWKFYSAYFVRERMRLGQALRSIVLLFLRWHAPQAIDEDSLWDEGNITLERVERLLNGSYEFRQQMEERSAARSLTAERGHS
jgi:hypothetical protein